MYKDSILDFVTDDQISVAKTSTEQSMLDFAGTGAQIEGILMEFTLGP